MVVLRFLLFLCLGSFDWIFVRCVSVARHLAGFFVLGFGFARTAFGVSGLKADVRDADLLVVGAGSTISWGALSTFVAGVTCGVFVRLSGWCFKTSMEREV